MKKQLLLLSTVLMTGVSFSQTIFSEDFEGETGLPTGWTQSNVDALVPAASMNFMGTNAWIVDEVVAGTTTCAISTSWYNPPGTSNDWLISPQVAVPGTGTYFLQFDAKAQDPSYPDGFKVYISTTGNSVADFGTTAALTVAAASSSGFANYSVPLAGYAGQNIYFAIQNNSTDKFLLFVDNVVVRQPSPDDAILVNATLARYSLTNTNNTLSMSVKNDGTNAITSLTVNWNDGTDHSSVIAVNIAPGATANVNHPTAVTYATAVERDIDVTITNVNGNADPNMGNNATNKLFNTVSQMAEKAVVIEEGTGTWCQWCPRGAVAMEHMVTTYPDDFIGIAVHNGDPMTLAAYDSEMNLGGYPGCNVDRALLDQGVSEAEFEAFYDARTDLAVPAAIDADFTVAGSSVTVDVTATFYTVFSAANYRLGVIITEDNVTGTSSGYNQVNVYAGGAQGPMGGFENLPNPVPAAQMVYDHVGRALLGGFDGQASSVPAAITDGQNVTYTFNYTVPGTSNRSNMHAVAVLIDQATGEIVNAKQISLASVGIDEAEAIGMEVFPNPASESVNVKFDAQGGDYTVTITDLSGRVVGTEVIANATGAQAVAMPLTGLASGNYLITVSTEKASFTQQVVVK